MCSIDELVLFDRFKIPDGNISFIPGGVDPTFLEKASKIFKTGTDAMLADPNAAAHFFQYGAVLGSTPFRKELAKFLTREYSGPVDANDLVQTNGASYGLLLLSSIFFGAGDIVFVEEASYFLAIRVLKDLKKMRLVPVAMDEHGMIPQSLEQALRDNSGGIPQVITEDKPYWAMLYTVPTFHNPTGKLMPPDRCREIVAIARQYNLLVVCDDVYNLLYFSPPEKDAKSPLRMFALDDKNDPEYKGNVVSNGSFSKFFAPGIRLGWLEAPKQVVDAFYNSPISLSGGGANHTMSHAVVELLRGGLLHRHTEDLRRCLQVKRDALCRMLREELPKSVTFEEPKGGFFLWITLPHGIDSHDVQEICQEQNVLILTGNRTSPEGGLLNSFRLSYSFYDSAKLVEGAKVMSWRSVTRNTASIFTLDPNFPPRIRDLIA